MTYGITVHPTPTVTAPANQTYCNGVATTAITLSGTPLGVVFDISGGSSVGLADQTGVTSIPVFTPVAGSATVSITPRANGCVGTAVTYDITVNPEPTLNTATQASVVCAGSPATINLTGLVPNTTFTLNYTINSVPQTAVTGLTAYASGNSSFNTLNLTATNNGQTLQIAGITITSSTPNCSKTFAKDVTLQVNSSPVLTSCPAGPINLNTAAGTCSATANYTVTASGLPAATYTYTFSGATTGSGNDTGTGSLFNIGTTTVRVTASNTCGSVGCTFTVTVVDNIPPTITCPSAITQNSASGSCNASVNVPAPTYGDNCSVSKLTWAMTGATTASSPPTGINEVGTYTFNVGVTTVTYTVTDAAGNPANCAFSVTITDNTPPVISGCPTNMTVNTGPGRTTCNQIASWADPTALDNCSGVLTYATRSHAPGALFNVGTTTVTYTFKDTSGNTETCTFTVTVVDNTPPTFTVPAATTVYTDATCAANILPAQTGSPFTLFDNCTLSTSLVVSYSDGANVPGTCSGNYSFTRSWGVTDAAGNSSTQTQVISVHDNVRPLITVPLDVNLQCGSSTLPGITGTATATDNCSGTISITYTDLATGGTCDQVITRTWRATDNCGNFQTGNQIIRVTDTQPPTVSLIFPTSVACPGSVPDPDPGIVIASDNCGTVTVTHFDDVANGLTAKPGYCPESITRTYRVTDICGNYTDATQTITITYLDPSCSTCEKCGTQNSFHTVNMTGTPTATITFTDVFRDDKCCPDINKQDICASFNVMLDKDAVGVQVDITNPAPKGKDQGDWWRVDCGDPNYPIVGGKIVCLPTQEFHLFTYCHPAQGGGARDNDWTFTSISGVSIKDEIRARVDCNQQLTVTGTLSPTWTSIYPGNEGDYNSYLSNRFISNPIFSAPEGAPPIVKYKICGNISGNICTPSGFDCDTVIVYVREDIEINININPDLMCVDNFSTISPTIAPAGNYTLEWIAPNGIRTIANSYTPSQTGLYTLVVTDIQGGLPCSTATQTFNVAFDLTGPSIQAPPSALEVQCNDPNYQNIINAWRNLATATYINAQGNTVTATVTNDFDFSKLNMTCGNVVTVTFSAVDQCSNSNLATSTITVIDNITPTITVSPQNMTVECDGAGNVAAYNAWLASNGGAVATDDCGTVSWTYTVTPMSDLCGMTGVATATFTASDCKNTVSAAATFTIIDTQPPLVTGTLTPSTIEGCSATAVPAAVNSVAALEALGITINDACSADAQLTVTSADASAGTCPVVITRTYTISDACGNSATVTQTISIDDTTPPAITCPGPYYQNANPNTCIAFPVNFGTATVTDNCGTYTVTSDAPAQFPVGVTTITWTATDACGNISTCEQYVTIYDIQPPVIDCTTTVINATVGPGQCDVAVGLITPTYTENCNANGSPTVTVTRSDGLPATANFPVGTTTVVWTVTDIYNNFATCTQTIIVTDNIAPTITCPTDVVATAPTATCQMLVTPIGPPTVNDNCGTYTLTWTKSGATTGSGVGDVNNTMFNGGVTSVTYTVTDAAGNSASCSFTVTVNDQVPPTITFCPQNVLETSLTDFCEFSVTSVPQPTAVDPCGSIVSITHNSPYATNSSTTDASGIYPVGTTTITWTITDNAGNIATCVQTVTVTDRQLPELTCPGDETYAADPGVLYKLNVDIEPPIYADNCPSVVLTWTMGGATTDTSSNTTGISMVPTPYPQLNVGVTTITYTLTDIGGQSVSCTFAITITSAPEIECADPIVHDADSGTCSHTVDPGFPTLVQGGQPIIWTWRIDGPGSPNEANGTFVGSVSNPGPPSIGPYPFKTGTSTITWTASNISGSDTCTQTVTVIDTEPPTYNPPPDDVEFCVINLISATYSETAVEGVVKNPDPDYYLFKAGDTDLDLDLGNVTDNCCASTANMLIRWEIHLSTGNVISGSNQPSSYTSDIPLWGDGINYQEVEHQIWYWITDCNGNEMVDPIVRRITVLPRPRITKIN